MAHLPVLEFGVTTVGHDETVLITPFERESSGWEVVAVEWIEGGGREGYRLLDLLEVAPIESISWMSIPKAMCGK